MTCALSVALLAADSAARSASSWAPSRRKFVLIGLFDRPGCNGLCPLQRVPVTLPRGAVGGGPGGLSFPQLLVVALCELFQSLGARDGCRPDEICSIHSRLADKTRPCKLRVRRLLGGEQRLVARLFRGSHSFVFYLSSRL